MTIYSPFGANTEPSMALVRLETNPRTPGTRPATGPRPATATSEISMDSTSTLREKIVEGRRDREEMSEAPSTDKQN